MRATVCDHERLRSIRLNRRERKEHVAVAVGCSYSMVSALERGAVNPSIDLLIKLARHYEVSLDALVVDAPAGAE